MWASPSQLSVGPSESRGSPDLWGHSRQGRWPSLGAERPKGPHQLASTCSSSCAKLAGHSLHISVVRCTCGTCLAPSLAPSGSSVWPCWPPAACSQPSGVPLRGRPGPPSAQAAQLAVHSRREGPAPDGELPAGPADLSHGSHRLRSSKRPFLGRIAHRGHSTKVAGGGRSCPGSRPRWTPLPQPSESSPRATAFEGATPPRTRPTSAKASDRRPRGPGGREGRRGRGRTGGA